MAKKMKKICKLQHKVVTRLLTKYAWAVKSVDVNGDNLVIHWNW